MVQSDPLPAAPLPLPPSPSSDFPFSPADLPGYVARHWEEEVAVIFGAPAAFVLAVAVFVIMAWFIFRFLHQRELATIPNLQTELSIREAEIARLKDRLTERDEDRDPAFSLFEIYQQQSKLYWRKKDSSKDEQLALAPDVAIPRDAVLILEVTVNIVAAPARRIQNIYLEMKGERLLENDWRPIGALEHPLVWSLHFDLPSPTPPGLYPVRLIATVPKSISKTLEHEFPFFDANIDYLHETSTS